MDNLMYSIKEQSSSPERELIANMIYCAIRDASGERPHWIRLEAAAWLWEFGPVFFELLDCNWGAARSKLFNQEPESWEKIWKEMPPEEMQRYE